jgi:hypothetical protein
VVLIKGFGGIVITLSGCYHKVLTSCYHKCYIVITMKDTYIRIRLRGEEKGLWQKEAARRGLTMTDLVIEAMEGEVGGVITGDGVPTDVITKESVPTKGKTYTKTLDVITRDDVWAEGLVESARGRGEPNYWAEVRGELLRGGYSYDSTTTELRKGGILVKRFY